MAWRWRFEGADGEEVIPGEQAPAVEQFPDQSDAESWVGEFWRDLLAGGVHQVSLFEDDRKVYGPMGLTES